jgi:hypothetical protein
MCNFTWLRYEGNIFPDYLYFLYIQTRIESLYTRGCGKNIQDTIEPEKISIILSGVLRSSGLCPCRVGSPTKLFYCSRSHLRQVALHSKRLTSHHLDVFRISCWKDDTPSLSGCSCVRCCSCTLLTPARHRGRRCLSYPFLT